MLFGEHAVIYNRPCLVTAVNQRMVVEMALKPDQEIEINAPDVKVINYHCQLNKLTKKTTIPKGVRFLETAVKNFFASYRVKSGLKIKTKSEFSSEFGFGSSSAVTVAALKGLSVLFKLKLSKKELFNLAYKTVLDVQGVGSGFDLAAAIWGGTVYFLTGGKKIIPLKLKRLPLIVGYTGIKADTPTLVHQVAQLYKSHRQLVNDIFNTMGLLTDEAKKSLIKADFKKTGELMNLNQGLLDTLGVNTPELANLIFAAREAGAYGAKLSGAGGGDCMIALVNKRNKSKVKKAIEKKGGEIINVEAEAQGVRVE